MRAIAAVATALVAACYSPSPQPGSPCVDNSNCPSPLICASRGTCERSDGAPTDAPPAPPDSCVPIAEICDNGIDEDCNGEDLSCFANDKAAGAVDVTMGGVFSGDAAGATDDVTATGCGLTGGRDLFYYVNNPLVPRVYYFDTFGSAYDTVLRVYAKPCAQVGAGAGATACVDDACGSSQSQVAVSLPAGESCIVVDQRDGATPPGALKLQVIRAVPLGGGKPLAAGVQTTQGTTTCDASNTTNPPSQCGPDGGGQNGKDHMYFFTACPGQALRIDADTCGANWDSVLHVWSHRKEPFGCDDDDDSNSEACSPASKFMNISLGNSPLNLLYVDGFEESACGAYTLRTNIR